jgi:alanyl-tRNA synthetase
MTSNLHKSAAQVRQEFIDYFVQRGHRYVPSSPVAPLDDATLLFTNAGMNQFKDVFLGIGKRDYRRAANSQKCIRVSGKHNDLEEVGLDTYHHTFFEMLGNWSFGDYFKEDAIRWSWELLTWVWGLPKHRLWVTVFAGDERDGLPADDDAARIWREHTDIDPTHILRFGRKDNFWEMGETGPCGPCTEIHIDRGGPGSNPLDGADRAIGVNAGNERFMELWNNVFMQFNRRDDGKLVELPAKHVDTGMGFERVLAVLQGKASNYDTDLFQPLFRRMEQLTGLRYGADPAADIAFRVCADHVRALSTAIADGALPSNEGRGYVLRRLLRRASRFGRQRMNMKQPFLFDVVPTVAEVLGGAFPELRAREEHIRTAIKSEEESFGVTLERGLVLFDQLAKKVDAGGAKRLPGGDAYDLYATYGFPQDLVEQMARERGWSLDAEGWNAAQEKHRTASRSEGAFKQLLSAEQLTGLPPTRSLCHEAGAAGVRSKACVLRSFSSAGQKDRVVLDSSPFYAESGGQIGDSGVLRGAQGAVVFEVEQTLKLGPVIVHVGKALAPFASWAESSGAEVSAEVDVQRRDATRRNHTATHLLHRALKEVLGAHVAQQGSYVGPDRLRFDFSHGKGLSAEELERIERMVNERVYDNAPVKTTVEELNAAKSRGVVAMFGEKYEAHVRVLDVGGWSMELCGGTHVRAAGDIGPFVVLSERAVAAGVRRIEALTGAEALAHLQGQRRALSAAAQALKTAPEELVGRIEQLQAQLKEARKREAASNKADITSLFETVKSRLVLRAGVLAGVIDLGDVDGESVRELGERVKSLSKDLAVALLGRDDGRVPFLIACEGAALSKGLKAGDLAKLAAQHLGGGGGGRPTLAQGQGLNPASAPAACAALSEALDRALGQ